jgi:hypothetical protein
MDHFLRGKADYSRTGPYHATAAGEKPVGSGSWWQWASSALWNFNPPPSTCISHNKEPTIPIPMIWRRNIKSDEWPSLAKKEEQWSINNYDSCSDSSPATYPVSSPLVEINIPFMILMNSFRNPSPSYQVLPDPLFRSDLRDRSLALSTRARPTNNESKSNVKDLKK